MHVFESLCLSGIPGDPREIWLNKLGGRLTKVSPLTMRRLHEVVRFVFVCRKCWLISSASSVNLDARKAPQQHVGIPLRQQLLPPTTESLANLRGGSKFTRRSFSRKQAWETAVKRGKGGFPGPLSWEPMDEEELRVKAENLLTPEV